ncbi:unnamed protein product, partial [Brassica oleracea]
NTITREKKENEMIALDPFVLPPGYYIKPQTIVLVYQLMAQYVQWHLFPISPELQEPLFGQGLQLSSAVACCFVSKIQENTRKRKGEASLLLCDYFD